MLAVSRFWYLKTIFILPLQRNTREVVKMTQIILKKNVFDLYSVVEFKNNPLDILADFLVRDGSEFIDYNDANYLTDPYIAWLGDKNPKNAWIGGNTMEMIKRNNKVFVRSQFRNNKDDYYGFMIAPEDMITIIKKWYDILAMDPLPEEVHLVQYRNTALVLPKFTETEDSFVGAVALKNN